MTPRMYFTLVLRGIGAWKFFDGLQFIVTAYNVNAGHYNTQLSDAKAFVAQAAVHLVFGLLLVLGAPSISALLVPPMPPGGKDDPANDKANDKADA